jgi:hypothetical protein
MPKVISRSIGYYAEKWIGEHPCPQTGSGNRAVHKWILAAANACKWYGVRPEQAFDFIADRVTGCGRHVSQREIREAIETAYNATVSDSKQRLG